jgi:hypothetical protein
MGLEFHCHAQAIDLPGTLSGKNIYRTGAADNISAETAPRYFSKFLVK